jgi:hypothetical protein
LNGIDDQVMNLHPDIGAFDRQPALAFVLFGNKLAYPGGSTKFDGMAIIHKVV